MAIIKKISDDTPPINKHFRGRHRDASGEVMHGVYLREYKNTLHKLFINNGHIMNTYRYPKIDTMFHSLMLNAYNLHLCGGWHFPGVEQTECLTRVIAGLKPMGFWGTSDEQQYEH